MEETSQTDEEELDTDELDNLLTVDAAIVDSTTTTTIDTSDDLPAIITVGEDNTNGINTATEDQVSLKVITNTASDIDGSTFQDLLDIPIYTLPTNTN